MTLRKPLSALLATLLLSTSFAAAADAATSSRHPARHRHAVVHRVAKSRPAAVRNAGSPDTDALNQQSLNSARGTAAQ